MHSTKLKPYAKLMPIKCYCCQQPSHRSNECSERRQANFADVVLEQNEALLEQVMNDMVEPEFLSFVSSSIYCSLQSNYNLLNAMLSFGLGAPSIRKFVT